MNSDYQLSFCKRCQNRKFDPERGIICSLTSEKATFTESCPDYEQDKNVELNFNKNTHAAASSKSWTILSVSVLVALLMVVLVSKLWNYEETIDKMASYDPFTNEDFITYGEAIENAINVGLVHEVNEALNYDYICQNVTSRLYERSYSRRSICNQISNWLPIGTNFHDLVWDGGDFEFTRFYKDEYKIPHLVFRAYGENSIKYMDFEVGVKNNELILNDAFDYILGSTYSEYLFNTLSLDKGFNIYENKQKEIDSRNTGIAIDLIQQLISEGNYEAAMAEWQSIPAFFKEKNFMAILHLQIAQGFDQETYENALVDYLDKFPGEKRLIDFYYMILYSEYGNVELTQFYTDKLKGAIGDDKLLDYFLGLAYFNAGEYDSALHNFNEVIQTYPEVKDVYIAAAEAAILTENIEYIEEITPKLISINYYSEKELDEIKTYILNPNKK